MPNDETTDEVLRLLIVEDDEDTAELLSQQLERDNLNVDIARNGQEAILVIGEMPPDIIIMDLMMPKLDGFETTRYFKAKFRNRFVPILVLTAKGDATSRARGARFGCEEYLTKPYARKELVAAIDVLLALGKLENELHRANQQLDTADTVELEDEEESVESEGSEEEDESEVPVDPLDPIDLEALEAARVARVATLEEQIVRARVAIAESQISGGRPEIARIHLERALELDAGSAQATELLENLGNAN